MIKLRELLDCISKRNWLVATIVGVTAAVVSFFSGSIFGRYKQAREDERILSQARKKVQEYQAQLDAAGDNVNLAKRYRRLLDAALKRVDELEGQK